MRKTPPLADRPSIKPILLMWVITLAALLVMAGAIFPFLKIQIYQVLWLGIMLLFVLLSIARALSDLVHRQFTWYELTPMQLYIRRGLITKDEKTIPLSAIQSCTIRWPLVGQWLDYGHVRVDTAAGGGVILRFVTNPRAWRDALQPTMIRPRTT